MKKLLAVTLCSLIAGAALQARTSWITFNQDVDDVEFWSAIQTKSSNGASELATMATTWTNQLGLTSGSYNVSLVLSNNYADNYPAPDAQSADGVNLCFNGANVKVVSGGTLGLRSKTAAADFNTSTGCGGIVFERGGNLEVSGTGRVFANDLQMYQNNYDKTVIVKDQAYFYTRGTTNIGVSGATTAQIVSFQGSQIQMAHLRNLRFRGAEGTTLDNVKGGKLEWIADANGITTVENESTPQEAMTGIISVDFTKLIWDESWGDTHTFTLLHCTGGSSYLTSWVSEYADTRGEILTVNGRITDDPSLGYFSANNANLFVTVARDAVVPEPATYAAIFGALALAFAAYRRRK